jgi:hypothetical protein
VSDAAEWDDYEWSWIGSLTEWALDNPGHPNAAEAECPSPGGPCRLVVLPVSLDEVRAGLAAASLSDVVVRMADSDDPAPVGSVLYAVPAGPVCVIGYLQQDSTDTAVDVRGRLPGGTCLSAWVRKARLQYPTASQRGAESPAHHDRLVGNFTDIHLHEPGAYRLVLPR